MMFAIKADVSDTTAETFAFSAQKTMYGGKQIAEGDSVFVFASENEGGPGLIARGVVSSAEAIAKPRGIGRDHPPLGPPIRRRAPAGPGTRRAGAPPSGAPRGRSGFWGGASSNGSPSGMPADPPLSSISSS